MLNAVCETKLKSIDYIGCSQKSDEEADLVEKTFNKIINNEI